MEAIEMIKGLFDHQLVTNSMYRNEVWTGIDGCTVQVLIRREYLRIRPYYTWQAEQVINTIRERKDQIKGFDVDLDGTNIILYRQ